MALYIYRANHWNFNQSMSVNVGKGDSKEYDSRLITPEKQEKLTKVFVSVFLEASFLMVDIVFSPTIEQSIIIDDIGIKY